jgi:hypothetical protein
MHFRALGRMNSIERKSNSALILQQPQSFCRRAIKMKQLMMNSEIKGLRDELGCRLRES